MEPRPLNGLSFSLVGPGRVGRSLASWLRARGARLRSVGVRPGPAPPPDWGSEVSVTPSPEMASRDDDLLLFCVPDGILAELAQTLAARPQATVALHAAGAQGAEVLAPLRTGGTAVGGLHPLRAFPRPRPELAVATRTVFGIGGDPVARELAHRLAAAWGAKAALIPDALRPLYHLAATLAAGGVVTLVAAAAELRERLELGGEVTEGLVQLARGALEEVSLEAPAAALTGPLARGELAYADRLRNLEDLAPELLPIFLGVARETLRQLARQGGQDEAHRALRAQLDALARRPRLP